MLVVRSACPRFGHAAIPHRRGVEGTSCYTESMDYTESYGDVRRYRRSNIGRCAWITCRDRPEDTVYNTATELTSSVSGRAMSWKSCLRRAASSGSTPCLPARRRTSDQSGSASASSRHRASPVRIEAGAAAVRTMCHSRWLIGTAPPRGGVFASACERGAADTAARPAILVIDDELGCRESLRLLLSPDCEVLCADSVSAALDILSGRRIDLVVSDVVMPVTDGIEGLAFIRKMRPDMPVIAYSGRSDEDMRRRAMDAGADAFMAKPFGVEEMRGAVAGCLRGRRDKARC